MVHAIGIGSSGPAVSPGVQNISAPNREGGNENAVTVRRIEHPPQRLHVIADAPRNSLNSPRLAQAAGISPAELGSGDTRQAREMVEMDNERSFIQAHLTRLVQDFPQIEDNDTREDMTARNDEAENRVQEQQPQQVQSQQQAQQAQPEQSAQQAQSSQSQQADVQRQAETTGAPAMVASI
ncbi:MAG: hypothetical protein FWH00_05165 [Oscillospiraceae bacterium]|nr:hypothetical protein [Oscillospiraceae bacterium]